MVRMMNFKDFLHQDLNTFINANEFGTTIKIEDEEVNVVPDDEKMVERKLAKNIEGELQNEELLFYVKKSDLSFYPRPDNVVNFDNIRWVISHVQEDEGMFTITCERVSG